MTDPSQGPYAAPPALIEEIRTVLMDAWDPLLVRNAITTRDEYEDVIREVLPLLFANASAEEIDRFLLTLERVWSAEVPAEQRAAVARRLVEIRQAWRS